MVKYSGTKLNKLKKNGIKGKSLKQRKDVKTY